jgi:hypothetical protein
VAILSDQKLIAIPIASLPAEANVAASALSLPWLISSNDPSSGRKGTNVKPYV